MGPDRTPDDIVVTPDAIFGVRHKWLPALLAVALSVPEVREPLLIGLRHSGRTLQEHTALLVRLFETFMRNPGANRAGIDMAVAKHLQYGISPQLIGIVWAVFVVLPVKALGPNVRMTNDYLGNAVAFGEALGVPADDFLNVRWSVLEDMVAGLLATLSTSVIDQGAIAALWTLIRALLEGSLQGKTEDEIVGDLLDLFPIPLVNQLNIGR